MGGLPHARGQTFRTLDEYLAFLQKEGAIGKPWYREVSPDVYELVTTMRPAPERQTFTRAELVEKFDSAVNAAAGLLESQPDDRMGEKWKLRSGDHVLFEMPRAAVVRFVGLNHVVHHRGQLSVYLRLLDVPVPSIYGPTADEPWGKT